MQAFRRFCAATRYSPEWCAALAAMQSEPQENGPRDGNDIAREDAQMRHDADAAGV
jgi:hypothetical protein